MRYYVDKTLSVGAYPEISLKRARERRHEIRTKGANGSNPSLMIATLSGAAGSKHCA